MQQHEDSSICPLPSRAPPHRAEGLTESDVGNLNAVLGHEVAANTIKNYRIQWGMFSSWARSRGVPPLPPRPRRRSRVPGRTHRAARAQARDSQGGRGRDRVRAPHREARQPCARPEVKRTTQGRHPQGWQIPKTGRSAHSRGVRGDRVHSPTPAARAGRPAREPADRPKKGQRRHRADRSNARRHAEGLRSCRAGLDRHK